MIIRFSSSETSLEIRFLLDNNPIGPLRAPIALAYHETCWGRWLFEERRWKIVDRYSWTIMDRY